MPCYDCAQAKREYGFILEKNNYYMTIVPEVKTCCATKVYVTDFNSTTTTFMVNDKTYSKPTKEFMRSSWRVYDSF